MHTTGKAYVMIRANGGERFDLRGFSISEKCVEANTDMLKDLIGDTENRMRFVSFAFAEMVMEPESGNGNVRLVPIGIWRCGKTGSCYYMVMDASDMITFEIMLIEVVPDGGYCLPMDGNADPARGTGWVDKWITK